MVQYSTALSHIFLASTGLFCLKALNNYDLPFAKLSFVIISINSLLGIWRWGNPTYGYNVEKPYRLTTKLQDLLILPCIVTTMWLKYNYSAVFVLTYMLVSLFPLLIHFRDIKRNAPVDMCVGANLISLTIVSYANLNFYGFTTVFSYLLSYFFIKRHLLQHFTMEMPHQDLYNYSLCFYAYFSFIAATWPVF